ncbi:MAG: InlB B-repeat-containing protein [Treponema sp.]|jgi:uncharacterized repeat protein (TIGR02543 family)|nr:InlB B-repeat-containing protein [Treponema sp.]
MKKYRALVLAAVSLLIACEHGADAPQEALVQVRIGHSQTRSVLPTAPNLEDMDWFTLYGTASGKDPSDPDYKESWLADFFYEDGVFYDYNNGTEAVVYVRPGTWRFVLYAYPPGGGTAALKGTEMVNITAGFDGTVNFTLSPYTGEESDTGYIFVYIALPEGSDVTAVETTIDGEPLDPPLIVDDDAVIYESDAIPVGQYLFSFTLKDSAEQTVAVISDVVVVSAGAESAKEYMLTDEDLNGPPAPPSDFVIESYDVENQTFRFTWQDNSFNETGFTLSDGTATHPIAATVQSFDLSVPDHSAPVTYALKAVNRFGESVAAQISGPLLFTVTFDADHDQGGEAQERQAYPGGSLGADAPSDPTRAGYTFDGWRTDRDGSGSVFTADTAVVRDMTVYAAWTEGAKYELTQNPGYDEYVCNADDLLPLGFTVEAGDQVTISLSIKTDTLMRNFCLGIADWENVDYYENSEDAWIAPGWEYAKYTVSADREFHSYTWVLTARTDAPAGPAPLVVQLAMDSVNQDKVSIYVKDVSVDKRSDLFAGLTLAESLAWISANAEQDGDYIITVKNNEPLTPQELYYSGRNVAITLRGDTAERIVSLGSNGSLFILGYGVTLTLGNNISLQGRGSNTASLVQVNSGGTLVMNSGSRIAGNTNSSGSGGGVVVDSGTLTMNGGAISGNSSVSNGGGGVFVDNGTLILNDGTIGGNTSGASGGGVLVQNSTFTMTGGTVNGNTSYQTSHGGGGVVVSGGTFTMTGGEISGNTA